MSPPRGPRKQKTGKDIAQLSLLMVVPAILIVAPLLGMFAGQWADQKLNTEPYLLIIGLILGFGAAAREIFNIVKKSEALGKDGGKKEHDDGNGVS